MTGSNTLWTAYDAAKATQGRATGQWAASSVSIDSRNIKPGDLFIALVGENHDGHDYVEQALQKGAVAAVVSKAVSGIDDQFLLIVPDTFKALQDLGIAARARCAAVTIGITGSVGKTGTKEMLATALGVQGQTHASKKSYNNHWGVPLSLASLHAGCDYAVFEMGMNHAGEITPLSQFVRPDIAIITTIAPAHIENFSNGLEGIAHAKSEIFEGMSKGGIAVLNKDNEWFDFLTARAQAKGLDIFSFGENDTADSRLISLIEASNGSRVKAKVLGQDIDYTLPLPGKHLVMNSLAVLLAVKLANGDIQKAAQALASQNAIEGRGKQELLVLHDPSNPVTLIDESYNASPLSMRAAFKVLALIDPGRGGRRIAILGDMLELGKDSGKYHAELALPLKAANVDLVYTCGKTMRSLHDALPANQRGEHRDNTAELAKIVPEVLVPGDVVMVKGSLGSKMGIVVEALRALPEKFKHLHGRVG